MLQFTHLWTEKSNICHLTPQYFVKVNELQSLWSAFSSCNERLLKCTKYHCYFFFHPADPANYSLKDLWYDKICDKILLLALSHIDYVIRGVRSLISTAVKLDSHNYWGLEYFWPNKTCILDRFSNFNWNYFSTDRFFKTLSFLNRVSWVGY